MEARDCILRPLYLISILYIFTDSIFPIYNIPALLFAVLFLNKSSPLRKAFRLCHK